MEQLSQANIGLDILTAMITPAILISACGALILSTSQRLGRIVDRTRKLSDVFAASNRECVRPLEGIDVDSLRERVRMYATRAKLLQTALMSLYLSVALLVATTLMIGLVATTHRNINWLPVSLALLSAIILFFGTVILLREAYLAVKSTAEEMHFIYIEIQAQERKRSA